LKATSSVSAPLNSSYPLNSWSRPSSWTSWVGLSSAKTKVVELKSSIEKLKDVNPSDILTHSATLTKATEAIEHMVADGTDKALHAAEEILLKARGSSEIVDTVAKRTSTSSCSDEEGHPSSRFSKTDMEKKEGHDQEVKPSINNMTSQNQSSGWTSWVGLGSSRLKDNANKGSSNLEKNDVTTDSLSNSESSIAQHTVDKKNWTAPQDPSSASSENISSVQRKSSQSFTKDGEEKLGQLAETGGTSGTAAGGTTGGWSEWVGLNSGGKSKNRDGKVVEESSQTIPLEADQDSKSVQRKHGETKKDDTDATEESDTVKLPTGTISSEQHPSRKRTSASRKSPPPNNYVLPSLTDHTLEEVQDGISNESKMSTEPSVSLFQKLFHGISSLFFSKSHRETSPYEVSVQSLPKKPSEIRKICIIGIHGWFPLKIMQRGTVCVLYY